MRLSVKYGFPDLRKHAFEHLMTVYGEEPSSTFGSELLEPVSRDDVTMLSLARETNAMILLPNAFYRLSLLPICVLFPLCAAYPHSNTDGNPSTDRNALLSFRDLQTIVSGKETLATECADVIARVMSMYVCDCNSRVECSEKRSTIFEEGCEFETLCEGQPLTWLDYIIDTIGEEDDDDDDGFCDVCRIELRDRLEEGKSQIWSRLPSTFRLPDWEELRESAKSFRAEL